MTAPARARVFQIVLVLTAIFNVLALFVLLTGSPIVFTVFMFLGQALFAVAVVLLLGGVLADLRAKQLF